MRESVNGFWWVTHPAVPAVVLGVFALWLWWGRRVARLDLDCALDLIPAPAAAAPPRAYGDGYLDLREEIAEELTHGLPGRAVEEVVAEFDLTGLLMEGDDPGLVQETLGAVLVRDVAAERGHPLPPPARRPARNDDRPAPAVEAPTPTQAAPVPRTVADAPGKRAPVKGRKTVAVETLLDAGWGDAAAIAEEVGCTPDHVRNVSQRRPGGEARLPIHGGTKP